MSNENPYESPDVNAEPIRPQPWILPGVTTVFVCAITGAILGCGAGTLLGSLMPSYYRSVFGAQNQPTFNPLTVGFGLGLTQGFVVGGCLGLGLVALYYWFEVRKKQGT